MQYSWTSLRIIFFAIALSVTTQSLAQRGKTAEAAPLLTPMDGWPGWFDSFAPSKGDLVGYLPLCQMDYGVTDYFSIGSQAIVPFTLLSTSPSGYGKLRYRLVPFADVSSTFTLYALYLSSQATTFGGYIATNNTTWFLSTHSWLNFHSMYGSIKYRSGQLKDANYASQRITIAAAALSYQSFPLQWLGIKGQVFVPFYASLDADTSNVSAQARIISSRGEMGSYMTATLDLPLAKHWLLSMSATSDFAISFILPTAEVGYRWIGSL